jgi:D-arabinose 1-dehydrogenase-like Zn-dependent alcohol dehydrogenase
LCLSRKILGIHTEGAFAEYVKVRERNLIRLPESISFKEASIITDAVGTPFHALVGRGKFSPGDSVAVIGCGGIGTNAIKLARLFGASLVVGIDALDSALQRAREVGADATINSSSQNVEERTKTLTQGQGVDISLECVGKKETIILSIQCLRIGGKAVLIGLGSDPVNLPPPTLFARSEFSFLGSYGFTKDDILRIMDLVLGGKIDLKSSITHTFPLGEINHALLCLRDKIGNPSRIVITPYR